MTTLPYLLTASLYLLLFYGCYALLLRRTTFFGLNRLYLLASVVLSMLLPLVQLPDANPLPVGTITLPAFTVGSPQPASSGGLTTEHWLWGLYALGVAVMLVRLGLNLRAVFRLIKRGTTESRDQLYTRPASRQPTNGQLPTLFFVWALSGTESGRQPDRA